MLMSVVLIVLIMIQRDCRRVESDRWRKVIYHRITWLMMRAALTDWLTLFVTGLLILAYLFVGVCVLCVFQTHRSLISHLFSSGYSLREEDDICTTSEQRMPIMFSSIEIVDEKKCSMSCFVFLSFEHERRHRHHLCIDSNVSSLSGSSAGQRNPSFWIVPITFIVFVAKGIFMCRLTPLNIASINITVHGCTLLRQNSSLSVPINLPVESIWNPICIFVLASIQSAVVESNWRMFSSITAASTRHGNRRRRFFLHPYISIHRSSMWSFSFCVRLLRWHSSLCSGQSCTICPD